MTEGDQQRFAPNSICFGCGPANQDGLQIASHWDGDPFAEGTYRMRFTPSKEHQAFPGVLNGGIIGTLLDCHSNWAAATAIAKHHGWPKPECTVTADFHVKLTKPTPFPGEVELVAKIDKISGEGDRMATVSCELWADTPKGRRVTATCTGHFVAVQEGHPAYHRWG